MGDFLRAVQSESVLGPTRRGFTRKQWQARHDELSSDAADESLRDAALRIFDKANAIRGALRLTFAEGINTTTKVRAFTALVNYNLCALQTKTREAMAEFARKYTAERPGSPLMAHELAALRIPLPIGAEYRPDEIVQAMVDGVQVPLKRILESTPQPNGNPQFSKLNWNDVLNDLDLGILYAHVEGLWDDCLWNYYTVDSVGPTLTFAPNKVHWQVLEAITRTRYYSLASEFAVRAQDTYTALFEIGQLPQLGSLCVREVSKTGKRQEIRLGTSQDSEAARSLFIMRAHATEPYYLELLNEAQQRLAGASLNQLLTGWTVISSAAAILRQSCLAETIKPSAEPRDWMPKFAPTLQITALKRAIATAASCTYQQAGSIVGFLTFSGHADQELWAQPLLPAIETTVLPVFAATTSPNLRRLMDVWLRQLGVDLGLRGPAFEAHVRQSLQENIANCPLFASTSKCLATGLRFMPPAEREEEIDVVAVVGNTLLIGESKCFLEPTEPKEVARHREKVLEAVEQVRRKADAVERHIDEFRVRALAAGLSVPTEVQVQPLVILNNAIHAGIAIDGVPVVDQHILGVLFRGELVELAVKAGGKPFAPIRKRVLFDSPASASDVLTPFLSAPPQMEPLRKGVTPRWVPILRVSEGDWAGQFLTVSCVPNVDPLGPGEDVVTTSELAQS